MSSRHVPIPASWLAYRPPGVAIGLAIYRGRCARCNRPVIALATVPIGAGGPGEVAPCDAGGRDPRPFPIAGMFEGLAEPFLHARHGERLDLVPHACAGQEGPHEYDPASLRTCSRCGRVRPWTDCYCPQCGNPEFAVPGRPRKRPRALKAKGGGH